MFSGGNNKETEGCIDMNSTLGDNQEICFYKSGINWKLNGIQGITVKKIRMSKAEAIFILVCASFGSGFYQMGDYFR